MTRDYSSDSSNVLNSAKEYLFSDKARDHAIIMVKTEFGKTAADIGAGTGFMTEGLLNAGLNVVIVEYTQEMIDILKQKFSHLREVQIIKSNQQKIDIADNSVDYVFSNMFLHNIETPVEMIKDMLRILKPGGKLAIIDLAEHGYEDFQKQFNHRWPGFNMPDMYEWFVQAGLKEISIEVLNQAVQVESVSGEIFKIGTFLAYGEKH